MSKRYIHLYFDDTEENRNEFLPLKRKIDNGWDMYATYQRGSTGRSKKIRARVLSVSRPRPEAEDPFGRRWLIYYDLGKYGKGWPPRVMRVQGNLEE